MLANICKISLKNISFNYQVCATVCISCSESCDVSMHIVYNDAYGHLGESSLIVKQTLTVGYNNISWVDFIDASNMNGEELEFSIALDVSSQVSVVGSGTRLIVIALTSSEFKYLPEPEKPVEESALNTEFTISIKHRVV